jgi:WD40 repeat protein
MLIVAGGNEGKIGIYDANTAKTIREWYSGNKVNAIKWSDDGLKIISGHEDGKIKI